MTPDVINYLPFIAGIVLIVVALAIAIWAWRRARTPLPELQIAVILERIAFSVGGILALLFLLLANAAVLYAWIRGLGGVSETSLALISLGSTVLGGLGVIIGRRRTYKVYRMPSSD